MSKTNIQVGDKYNNLTVIERRGSNSRGHSLWLVRCACGTEKVIRGSDFIHGGTKTCGCSQTLKVSVGDRYGKLVVLERVQNNKDRQAQWLCQCDCGVTTIAKSYWLTSGHKISCGCKHSPNLVGERFGRLLVTEETTTRNNSRYWVCKCDCGSVTINKTSSLLGTKGHAGTKSCGCLQKEKAAHRLTTHGQSHTSEYQSAVAKQRRDRVRELGPENYVAIERAVRSFFGYCVVCGITDEEHIEKYNTRLHVDHVYPSKPEDGSQGQGLYPGNVCVLCTSCNSRKLNRLSNKWPIGMKDKVYLAAESFKQAWESGFRA